MRSASALVFPSLSQGFGIPIVEDAMFSLAVICSDLPVFRKIAGALPISFDPCKVSVLAQRLDKIALNTAAFRQQVTALRNRCLARYEMDPATAKLAKFLALQHAD